MKNKKVTKLWFDSNRLYVEMTNGDMLSKPLRFFYHLQRASDLQRQQWYESALGLHWDTIDEDISFESLYWDENDPNIHFYQPTLAN